MKKVLFTLALAAFGLIAGAQDKPAPKLAFGTDANNLITEIELAPGQQSDQIQVILVEQQEVVAMGFQLQWKMKDVNGQPTDKVVCPNAIPDDPDFPMDYAWSVPLGLSTAAAANGGIPGNALAVSNPLFATWRWVGTNTSRNQFWWPRGNFMPPIAVGAMVFQPAADWNEEYATFELDLDYALYNQTWETTPSSMKAYEARPTDPMVLKIKNKNYQPATVADPVISFAEENNVLTVTVTAEEGCTLIVNGTAVESNVYSYTVEHENLYEEQVVNVTAQAVKGDATSNEVNKSYTFQAQEQPTEAETPVITFSETFYNGQVSIVQVVVTNATSYTITVDGEEYNSNFIQAGYDAEKVIVVEAENNPGAPYTPAYASDSYTLNKLNKKEANAPTITTNTTATEVIVTVTKDPNTDGQLVYDGQSSYTRGDADYEVTVSAYTEEGATYLASETTTLTFVVPAYIPPTPVETTTFVKVTSADQLVAGKHYIFVHEAGANSTAMGAINDNTYGTAVPVTLNGDEVEASEEVVVFALGEAPYYTLPNYATFAFENGNLLGGLRTGSSSYNYVYGFTEGGNYTTWRLYTSNGNCTAMNYQYDRYVKFSNNAFTLSTSSTSDYAYIYVEKPGDTPVLEDLTGNIVVSQPDENGVVTVTYDGPETVTITVNGEPVAESYQLEDGVPMTFEVTVTAEGYNDLTDTQTRTWNKPAPVLEDLTGNIVVSQPDENGVVTVTYDGPETVTITVNGEPVAESYQLEDGVPMTFEVTVSATGYNDLTDTQTRTWNKPAPVAWADPVVVVDDAVSEDGFLYATITWEEGGELYIDGELVEGVASPYRYKIAAQSYVDQEGSFFTQVKGGERPASQNVRTAWTLEAKEHTYAPTPKLSYDEETLTVTATLENREYTNADIVLYKENEVVANPYTMTQTYQPQHYMFKAYVPGEGEDLDSPFAYLEVNIPAKEKTLSSDPSYTVQEGDEAYVITGTGSGTVVVYDSEGNEIDNPFTVVRTDETQTIIFDVENTDADTDEVMYKPNRKTFTVIVPALQPVTPPAQCAKPDGGYVNGHDFHGVTVTLTNNETAEGTQLHYTVTKDGVVITEDAIYEGPFNLTEDGDYNIDFWATAPGMDNSTHGGLIFTIDETTGLSELLEGKNVVSVRYFNMAGQEMQEANGMTIVVTTYTDGTSSAVKVLK